MKIETDKTEFLSGLRQGGTLGSPITILIRNKDWENWQEIMAPFPSSGKSKAFQRLTSPRPGHADLAGAIKYGHKDFRNVLERSSARETAARTAAGAVALQMLKPFGVKVFGSVIEIGGSAG